MLYYILYNMILYIIYFLKKNIYIYHLSLYKINIKLKYYKKTFYKTFNIFFFNDLFIQIL